MSKPSTPTTNVQATADAAEPASRPSSLASNVQAAIDAAQLLTNTLAELEARKQELTAKRSTLEARNAKLYDMPLLREEAKAMVLGNVDALAKQFPGLAGWPKIFESYAKPAGDRHPKTGAPSDGRSMRHSGWLSLADLVDCEERKHQRNPPMQDILGPDVPGFFGGHPSESVMLEESRAAFFFGDLIKARVERYFDTMFPTMNRGSDADSTLTVAQRQAEIAVNDMAIAELDEELAAIDSQIDQVKAVTPKERVGRL